jgi:hypothetical protein
MNQLKKPSMSNTSHTLTDHIAGAGACLLEGGPLMAGHNTQHDRGPIRRNAA